MVEVNGVRLNPITLSQSIQGCPFSPMLYIFVLKPFLHKLRTNLVLCSLTLLGAITMTRYSIYADDVSVLVTSSAEVKEVSKEIRRYEGVLGIKIKCEKSVGLQLGLYKSCALPSSFSWMDSLCKILGVWFGLNLQLEKNWSEVQ